MGIVTVSDEARKYIEDNGGAVSVRMVKGQGGCCTALSPVIELRKPPHPDEYTVIEAEGILFYLQEGIEVLPDGGTVFLNKLLWVKKLGIRGLNIFP